MSLTGLTDHLDENKPPARPEQAPPPKRGGGGGGLAKAFFLAAVAFAGWHNRVFLGRAYRRLLVPNLKAAAREAQDSGSQLLAEAGVMKAPSESLPQQPEATALPAPRATADTRRPDASARPEDNVRKDQRPHKAGEGRMPWEQFTRSEVAQAQGRLYRKQAGVDKNQGGAEFITQRIDAPWILYDENVPFWQTQLGRGVKAFICFSLFFLTLGSVLFRVNKKHYKTF